MKVKELIKHLERFNPEDTVVVWDDFGQTEVEFVWKQGKVFDAEGNLVSGEEILIS